MVGGGDQALSLSLFHYSTLLLCSNIGTPTFNILAWLITLKNMINLVEYGVNSIYNLNVTIIFSMN